MSQTVPEADKKRVGDIMTSDVITAHPDMKVSQIARLMAENNIGGLPIVDDSGHVQGVVTELDMIVRNTRFKVPTFFMILDSIIYLETPKHFRERLAHMLGTTAKEIMSKPAVTIAPDASIEELAELMVGRRMNPIPVVKDNRLVGIVSRSDIVQMMAQEFNDNDGGA